MSTTTPPATTTARVQLALNVSDLEGSIAFYTALFGTAPHKLRAGYANFVIENPPLKLVLIETTDQQRGTGTAGALNHLGVELAELPQVGEHADRLRTAGLLLDEETDTTCCFALQDKVWAHDPAGTPWEFYAIKDDNPDGLQLLTLAETATGECCAPGTCC
jgi:catechol 2,3-dioxygenase-like lactoylglutathione lyase family enzyme